MYMIPTFVLFVSFVVNNLPHSKQKSMTIQFNAAARR